jgi:parvulin-like peptidyl-prolyl isomerase
VDPSFGVAAANLEEAIQRKRDFADAKREGKMRALQIVVESQSEAEAIRAQIKTSADFARLAREKSLASNASAGGDMGFFSPGDLDDETASAVKRLAPGETSGVVHTPDGWAILQRVN